VQLQKHVAALLAWQCWRLQTIEVPYAAQEIRWSKDNVEQDALRCQKNYERDSEPFMWTLNSDKRVKHSFEHKNHGRRKVRIRMSDAIKSFILENGVSSSPANIADSIFTTFKVHISESRIIWHKRRNNI
jgi:hypothetical protein